MTLLFCPHHGTWSLALVGVLPLSCVWFFATLWTEACQASLFFTTSQSMLKFMSIELVMPSNHLSLCRSFLLSPSIFHSFRIFLWVSSSHQVTKVLEFQLQHQSFQWIFRTDFLEYWLVWSPWCPQYSQEPSPTPQFKSLNSSVLSLYGSTLTSVHDYWENHSWDNADLCWQIDVSAF